MGPLEVRDDLPTEDYAERTLLHGTINHGSQFLDPVLRYVTTSYYGKRSGVGRAMTAIEAQGPARAALSAWVRECCRIMGARATTFRIYEINPLVEGIAQTLFTFYPHSPADKKILMGDARLTLEEQEPQNFDVLAVDAFSSDAIPVHLLTREAVQRSTSGIFSPQASWRCISQTAISIWSRYARAALWRSVNRPWSSMTMVMRRRIFLHPPGCC